MDRSYNLPENWHELPRNRLSASPRKERDERQRLSTSADVLGLTQNLRVQWQTGALTVALLVVAVLTIALTVVSLGPEEGNSSRTYRTLPAK